MIDIIIKYVKVFYTETGLLQEKRKNNSPEGRVKMFMMYYPMFAIPLNHRPLRCKYDKYV